MRVSLTKSTGETSDCSVRGDRLDVQLHKLPIIMEDELINETSDKQSALLRKRPRNSIDYFHLNSEEYKVFRKLEKTKEILKVLELNNYEIDAIFEASAKITAKGSFKEKVIFAAYDLLKDKLETNKARRTFFRGNMKAILKFSKYKNDCDWFDRLLKGIISSLSKLKEVALKEVVVKKEIIPFECLIEGVTSDLNSAVAALKLKSKSLAEKVELKRFKIDEVICVFIHSGMNEIGFELRKDVFSKFLGFRKIALSGEKYEEILKLL